MRIPAYQPDTLQALNRKFDVLRRRWPVYLLLSMALGGSLSLALFSGSAAHSGADPVVVPRDKSHLTALPAAGAPSQGSVAIITNHSLAVPPSASPSTSTTVQVNGQNIPVPSNNTTVTNVSNGGTTTHVVITQSTAGSTSNTSSLHLTVHSDSSSTEVP